MPVVGSSTRSSTAVKQHLLSSANSSGGSQRANRRHNGACASEAPSPGQEDPYDGSILMPWQRRPEETPKGCACQTRVGPSGRGKTPLPLALGRQYGTGVRAKKKQSQFMSDQRAKALLIFIFCAAKSVTVRRESLPATPRGRVEREQKPVVFYWDNRGAGHGCRNQLTNAPRIGCCSGLARGWKRASRGPEAAPHCSRFYAAVASWRAATPLPLVVVRSDPAT